MIPKTKINDATILITYDTSQNEESEDYLSTKQPKVYPICDECFSSGDQKDKAEGYRVVKGKPRPGTLCVECVILNKD